MRRVNDILFISIGIIDASLLGDLATWRLNKMRRATLTNLGEVKIIVGERNNKRMIHYCITKKIKE